MLARLVYLAFNVYALGLIAYAACSWLRFPQASAARNWLQRWYEPLLSPLRRAVKPVQIGDARVDLSTMLLLVGIVIARELVVSLLVLPY